MREVQAKGWANGGECECGFTMTRQSGRFVDAHVGVRIRALRQQQRLSLRQVANGQISASAIARIETAQRVPSLEALIFISSSLGKVAALELATGQLGDCPYCGRKLSDHPRRNR
jgi:transcriptional regulator with XRE-family HTH domain